MTAHLILYVVDQAASTAFYASVLDLEPRLNVPGMTEFELGRDCVLGLMPETSAARLLNVEIVSVGNTRRLPRAELYLIVDAPSYYHRRALAAGAREISPLSERDWGHRAAYSFDPDGHVLAFAETTPG